MRGIRNEMLTESIPQYGKCMPTNLHFGPRFAANGRLMVNGSEQN